MLRWPRSTKRGAVVILDILICIFSTWISFGLRLDQWGWLEGNRYWALIAAIGFMLPLFMFFGLYRTIFRYVGFFVLESMVRVLAIYLVLYVGIFTIVGVEDIPRSIGVIQPIILIFCIGIGRYLIQLWLGSVDYVGRPHSKQIPVAIIYGAGSAGRQLASALSLSGQMLVKGFIDDDRQLQGNTIDGINVYGNGDLSGLISRQGITDVLLAIPSANQSRRNQIITSLEGCGVRVRTLPGVIDLVFGRVRISDLHDLDMNDLLGRQVVPPNVKLLEANIRNQVVLVTGAGGSIGSELCRQIIKFLPKSIILVESSEHALYVVYEELKHLTLDLDINYQLESTGAVSEFLIPRLASVRDVDLVNKIFDEFKPNTVFHAAAYKHVPLVEQNAAEGIRNNVLGTQICAQAALDTGTSCFILISTDKAVRPTNVMGASKRVAELVLQAMSEFARKNGCKTKFSMVRFGNVLGSSGSVAPLFSAQIKAGGPITLTHPEVTRYFMTIPEAAQLVIQASAMSTGGDVFVLDMGKPVRIYDLAVKMIFLSGLMLKNKDNMHGDIEIQITGLRPGEKLYEELLIGNDPQPTDHPKIMKAHEEFLSKHDLELELERLNRALSVGDSFLIRKSLKSLVPGYQPTLT
ncbi:polysaccharide biosynthesis protein [Polynucleobacter sp. AM-7D1]|nr:polysaccharide biosynthesis protein [Polynucleobacter sp. AM-7D1]